MMKALFTLKLKACQGNYLPVGKLSDFMASISGFGFKSM
jgi:hypothetical protein